jgi:hypothetical protein
MWAWPTSSRKSSRPGSSGRHLTRPAGRRFAGGPVALAYSRFDEGTRQAVHAEYLASIAPWRSGSGYAVPGEFVVVAGRRPD